MGLFMRPSDRGERCREGRKKGAVVGLEKATGEAVSFGG